MKNANVALLQLCSGTNIKHNLAQIEQQIKQLPDNIKLVMTPENALIFASGNTYQKYAEVQGEGPLQSAVADMARRYGVWILVGSMPMISRETRHVSPAAVCCLMIKGKSKPVTTKFTCLT